VRGQRHAPAALYLREKPGTYCTRGWVGPRAGVDRCGKSRPPRDSIPGPSIPYLYRPRYPAHNNNNKYIICTVTTERRVPEFVSGLYKSTCPCWDPALALECAQQDRMAQIVRRDCAATFSTSLYCMQSKRKRLLEVSTAADEALTYRSIITLFDDIAVTADIWRCQMTYDKIIMNCESM
jgi:hypothetical protein